MATRGQTAYLTGVSTGNARGIIGALNPIGALIASELLADGFLAKHVSDRSVLGRCSLAVLHKGQEWGNLIDLFC